VEFTQQQTSIVPIAIGIISVFVEIREIRGKILRSQSTYTKVHSFNYE